MSGLPPGLALYRAGTQLLAPLVPGHLRARARRGKEDPTRLGERLGTAPAEPGTGLLVWLHGASVGESQVCLSLARALLAARDDARVLITTGTLTSAALVGRQTGPRLLHRFVPVDTPGATAGFLEAWQPSVGVFVESELWPNLILGAAERGVPLALLNARMNARSVRNWGQVRGSAARLLGAFNVLQAADGFTADALADLAGRDVAVVGNLKLAATPPTVDAAALAAIRAGLAGRPVWLAASTHPGEEEIVLAAHRALLLGAPDALLILAPRHPDRAMAVQSLATRAGLTTGRRSLGTVPDAETPVWLWDTLGELGLAYALAPVCVVAGSLVPGIGGHNPVEPAQIGSAMLTGPYSASFGDLMAAVERAGGVRVVDPPSGQALAVAVAGLMGDSAARTGMVNAAGGLVQGGQASMDTALGAVLGLMPPPAFGGTP